MHEEWINKIHEGNTLDVLKKMPSNFVDCVITSPPYWSLRVYETNPQVWDGDPKCEHEWEKNIGTENKDNFCSKCGAWKGELGLEKDFADYIYHLCSIFDEVKRVLKKTGVIYVNLGDTYFGGCGGPQSWERKERNIEWFEKSERNPHRHDKGLLPSKSLCQIPSRFAIEMSNRGWILRNELIWWKRNSMPSSVKDRYTVDYEKIFFMVKNRKYFFEQQREERKDTWGGRWGKMPKGNRPNAMIGRKEMTKEEFEDAYQDRNKRCVWDVTTESFSESHFAVFPEALVLPMIKSGTPRFICKKCGKPREKIIETEVINEGDFEGRTHSTEEQRIGSMRPPPYRRETKKKEIGYTDCGCGEEFIPGIVMDIFCGSGTTCKVAKDLGLNFIGVELNPDFVKMSNERIAGFEKKDWEAKREHKPLTDILKQSKIDYNATNNDKKI
jgi:site-specific DNA-methyltransferase (adenine-specific)